MNKIYYIDSMINLNYDMYFFKFNMNYIFTLFN